MPALQSIAIIGTSADNNLPTLYNTGSTHRLNAPTSSETGAANQVIYTDCHETINMPVGIIAFITAREYYDAPSTPSDSFNSPLSHVVVGSGSGIALSVGAISPNASGYTFDNFGYVGHINFLQTSALRYVLV